MNLFKIFDSFFSELNLSPSPSSLQIFTTSFGLSYSPSSIGFSFILLHEYALDELPYGKMLELLTYSPKKIHSGKFVKFVESTSFLFLFQAYFISFLFRFSTNYR